MSVRRKIDILERQGKITEARKILASVIWYRCGHVYYKPSSSIILDGNKKLKGDLNIKDCVRVPFSHVDALEAKIGITNMPGVSKPQPKGGCCS